MDDYQDTAATATMQTFTLGELFNMYPEKCDDGTPRTSPASPTTSPVNSKEKP